MNNIFSCKIAAVRPYHQVACAKPEATPVCKKVFNSELFRYIRAVQPEFGDNIRNFGIPCQFTFIHQHTQRRSGKGLAVGGNTKNSFGIYFFHGIQRTHAIASGMGHFTILHYCYSHTRHIKCFEHYVHH